jgi:hypothetical protein
MSDQKPLPARADPYSDVAPQITQGRGGVGKENSGAVESHMAACMHVLCEHTAQFGAVNSIGFLPSGPGSYTEGIVQV